MFDIQVNLCDMYGYVTLYSLIDMLGHGAAFETNTFLCVFQGGYANPSYDASKDVPKNAEIVTNAVKSNSTPA